MSVESAPLYVPAKFPLVFKPLLERKARYKVFYGGRGGAKSWQFARALLIIGLRGGVRILCTREVQSSLKGSSKQLLADQIRLLGLDAYYRIMDDEIRGPDGTLFVFKGLRDPEALKSAEGVDYVWIEEARVVSEASWKKLDFTIRKPGAEIWVSFNPELEQDFIWSHFIKNAPPPNSIVQKVTYRDNPWLDKAMVEQLEHLRDTDYDEYLWVAEGHCKQALDGAVYVNELRALAAEDRATLVPYLPGKPVQTFWDLGYADHTAIWFIQAIGFRYHVIDYYENHLHLVDHYIQELQKKPYTYGIDWLPHDAKSNHPGVERTVERQLKDAGRQVKIVPSVSIADGINAARSIFPVCIFDQAKCAPGLDRLRSYRYGVDERNGKWTRAPIHDAASHAADAWRMAGVALRGEQEKKAPTKPKVSSVRPSSTAWMG